MILKMWELEDQTFMNDYALLGFIKVHGIWQIHVNVVCLEDYLDENIYLLQQDGFVTKCQEH